MHSINNFQEQYGDSSGMKPQYPTPYNQVPQNSMANSYSGSGAYNRPNMQYSQGGSFSGQQEGYNSGYNSSSQYQNRMPNQYAGYDNR